MCWWPHVAAERGPRAVQETFTSNAPKEKSEGRRTKKKMHATTLCQPPVQSQSRRGERGAARRGACAYCTVGGGGSFRGRLPIPPA